MNVSEAIGKEVTIISGHADTGYARKPIAREKGVITAKHQSNGKTKNNGRVQEDSVPHQGRRAGD